MPPNFGPSNSSGAARAAPLADFFGSVTARWGVPNCLISNNQENTYNNMVSWIGLAKKGTPPGANSISPDLMVQLGIWCLASNSPNPITPLPFYMTLCRPEIALHFASMPGQVSFKPQVNSQ